MVDAKCCLTNEPLKPPVAVDRLGNLFNMKPLVEAVVDRKVPEEFWHIKSLKDMVAVEMEMSGGGKFRCPFSGVEMNGEHKFFVLKSCGHVVSDKALEEVNSSECRVCGKKFEELDKVVIKMSGKAVSICKPVYVIPSKEFEDVYASFFN